MNRLAFASLAFASAFPGLTAAQVNLPDVQALFSASTQYYEYSKDGGGILGFVTDQQPGEGKVSFTTCSNKTVTVLFADLRASKARCPKPLGPGIWSADSNTILPVFRVPTDKTNTMVILNGTTIDLTKLQGWSSEKAIAPTAKASEPVGFVFTNSNGVPAMAILRRNTSFDMPSPKPGEKTQF